MCYNFRNGVIVLHMFLFGAVSMRQRYTSLKMLFFNGTKLHPKVRLHVDKSTTSLQLLVCPF